MCAFSYAVWTFIAPLTFIYSFINLLAYLLTYLFIYLYLLIIGGQKDQVGKRTNGK